jgi:hypothetical protein
VYVYVCIPPRWSVRTSWANDKMPDRTRKRHVLVIWSSYLITLLLHGQLMLRHSEHSSFGSNSIAIAIVIVITVAIVVVVSRRLVVRGWLKLVS